MEKPTPQNYIEFQTYRPGRFNAVPDQVIRIYQGGMSVINSLTPFVFATEVVRKFKGKEIYYYELRNSELEILYVTDEQGYNNLFGGETAVPA